MSDRPTAISRRGLLGTVAAAGVAAPVLAACGAPSSPNSSNSSSSSASAAPTIADSPSAPVVLNILDVAGNLALTQPAIEAFATAHPKIVSNITYSTGTAPDLAGKIQAEQQAGNVQTNLVLTGTDGLADGIQQNLWQDVDSYYDQFFPNLMANYQPAAASMATLAQNKGIELVWYPSGPLIEYNPATVKTVPDTTAALLAWAKANSGKFQYAEPRNSGPGRTLLMGLPYLLGDKDPGNPTTGWAKTWNYLAQLNDYIASYPSGTSATMKNIAAGTVDIIASTTGWYINGRAIGTVPKPIAVAKFKTFTWVSDAQYGVIPKGVSSDVLIANLRLLAWLLTPEQQAVTYDQGYFYPGPAVKNVPLSKAPVASRQCIAEYGVSAFAGWMTQYPMKNSLPAPAQVTAFDLWDTKIGSTK